MCFFTIINNRWLILFENVHWLLRLVTVNIYFPTDGFFHWFVHTVKHHTLYTIVLLYTDVHWYYVHCNGVSRVWLIQMTRQGFSSVYDDSSGVILFLKSECRLGLINYQFIIIIINTGYIMYCMAHFFLGWWSKVLWIPI